MLQRDYVYRDQLITSRCRKNILRKKKNNLPFVLIITAVITAIILVTFINSFYFFIIHQKKETSTIKSNKITDVILPPKPKERWRYIKELESCQPGWRAPNNISVTNNVHKNRHITDEKNQMIKQMKYDTCKQQQQRKWTLVQPMQQLKKQICQQSQQQIFRIQSNSIQHI